MCLPVSPSNAKPPRLTSPLSVVIISRRDFVHPCHTLVWTLTTILWLLPSPATLQLHKRKCTSLPPFLLLLNYLPENSWQCWRTHPKQHCHPAARPARNSLKLFKFPSNVMVLNGGGVCMRGNFHYPIHTNASHLKKINKKDGSWVSCHTWFKFIERADPDAFTNFSLVNWSSCHQKFNN